jgi:tetratricopeptide (TPR) repeat protein
VVKTQSLQVLCDLGGEAYDEIEIPEEIAVQNRRTLFDASVRAFLPHRTALAPKNAGEIGPPSDDLFHALETEEDYDRPLAVQIAALLHVAGVDVAEDRSGMAGLLDKILGLEKDHWDKALRIREQPNWQTAIKNGVAQVTLVGHTENAPAAEALIERDPLFRNAKDIDVPRVRHRLSLIFPGESDGLAGLEPDLIGEHHVADVATDALVDACIAWSGDDSTRRQHILTVLNRATRVEHGAKASRAAAQLDRLVRTQAAGLGGDLVKVALETPGRLLDLCPALKAQLDRLDEPALAAIDAALPMHSLTLMELSLAVAAIRVDLARKLGSAADAAEVLNHLASRVGTLGIRLSNLGRREEALAASQEAVDIRRRLAQTRPDAFLPDLATSLGALSVALTAAERHGDAAAATHEGLMTIAPLLEKHAGAFDNLAGALVRNYFSACEKAGTKRDLALLERVTRALKT